MESFIRIVGSFAVSLFIFSIPILTTMSFCLGWIDEIKFLLAVATSVLFLLVWGIIDSANS